KGNEVQEATIPTAGAAARPVVRTRALEETHIDDLLRLVVEKGGSDLHLCVGVPPIIRIDGQLTPVPFDRVTPQDSQRMGYDILTDEQIQRFESTLELDCSYSLAKISRFRVNVYKDKGTIAAAFRVIPTRIPTLDELGLPRVLAELARKKR